MQRATRFQPRQMAFVPWIVKNRQFQSKVRNFKTNVRLMPPQRSARSYLDFSSQQNFISRFAPRECSSARIVAEYTEWRKKLEDAGHSAQTFARVGTPRDACLLRLDAGVANDFGPARDLGLDPLGRLFRRSADRLIALHAEFLDQLRLLERAVGGCIELRNRGRRGSDRRRKAVPADHVEARNSAFGDGRQVRRERRALS